MGLSAEFAEISPIALYDTPIALCYQLAAPITLSIFDYPYDGRSHFMVMSRHQLTFNEVGTFCNTCCEVAMAVAPNDLMCNDIGV